MASVAARGDVARYWPATTLAGLLALGFVLLLTPTGALPSPRWHWWAWVTVAVPAALLLAMAAFSVRLRQQVDLDTLTAELLAVVDQTMQPTRMSLWLRPTAAPQGGTSTGR